MNREPGLELRPVRILGGVSSLSRIDRFSMRNVVVLCDSPPAAAAGDTSGCAVLGIPALPCFTLQTVYNIENAQKLIRDVAAGQKIRRDDVSLQLNIGPFLFVSECAESTTNPEWRPLDESLAASNDAIFFFILWDDDLALYAVMYTLSDLLVVATQETVDCLSAGALFTLLVFLQDGAVAVLPDAVDKMYLDRDVVFGRFPVSLVHLSSCSLEELDALEDQRQEVLQLRRRCEHLKKQIVDDGSGAVSRKKALEEEEAKLVILRHDLQIHKIELDHCVEQLKRATTASIGSAECLMEALRYLCNIEGEKNTFDVIVSNIVGECRKLETRIRYLQWRTLADVRTMYPIETCTAEDRSRSPALSEEDVQMFSLISSFVGSAGSRENAVPLDKPQTSKMIVGIPVPDTVTGNEFVTVSHALSAQTLASAAAIPALGSSYYKRQARNNELGAALGYCAHVVALASEALDVPLVYPITFMGLKSCITDNFASPPRTYNLFVETESDKMGIRMAVEMLEGDVRDIIVGAGRGLQRRLLPFQFRNILLNLDTLLEYAAAHNTPPSL